MLWNSLPSSDRGDRTSATIRNDARPKPLKQVEQVRLHSSKFYTCWYRGEYTCHGEVTHRIRQGVIMGPLILHVPTVFFSTSTNQPKCWVSKRQFYKKYQLPKDSSRFMHYLSTGLVDQFKRLITSYYPFSSNSIAKFTLTKLFCKKHRATKFFSF